MFLSLLIGATVSNPRRGGEQEQKLLQHKNNQKEVKKRSELAPTNVFCSIPSSPCRVHNLDTETCLFTATHSKNPRRFFCAKARRNVDDFALIGGDAIRYVNRVGGFGEQELRRAPPLVRRRCPYCDSASAEAFSRSLKYIILVLIRRSPGVHPMCGSRRGTVPQGCCT